MDPSALTASQAGLEKRFGNYTILEHLGRGGMGDVYKAVHTGLDRVVALKILPPQLARSREFSERFEAEAYAISRLQHQNIVTVYDYGEVQEQKFIAMQFVQGRTLGSLIRAEFPLDMRRAIHLVKQICRGLKYAHENDVVHRDVKSGNILVAEGDKAYLSDFGIAKVVDSPAITTAGMALGTPEYMAPEQCEGGAVDAQSDLYALGVILYEMAAGQPPFLADTPLAVAFKQVHEAPPLLGKVRPDIPPRYELIVAKCLKKKKEERYRSADELLRDLDTVFLELQAAAQPAPATVEQRITDRRLGDRRLPSAGRRPLVAALLLLAAAAGMLGWQIFYPSAPPGSAAWIRPAAEGGEAKIWDGDRTTQWTPAPGQSSLGVDLGGPHVLQALYLESPAGGEGAILSMEVSLDGKKPLRYAFDPAADPQAFQLQGRIASRLEFRFQTRGGPPVLREMRLLGLPYE